ncbi:Molybdopterin adenylyltransferase [Aphelenchoides besseyi]|nr:Molybdopterin adenylyltransferase [Aphelenchoides besseyi]KAI6236993.1 Molybdopterin adenylyltransferase [Aphelenchoides besseyi]
MRVGILTISDTCANDASADRSGPELRKCLQETEQFKDCTFESGIVSDDVEKIERWLREHLESTDFILTTGGTGFSHRDVTPEATRRVIERSCPGIVVALLQSSLNQTPLAALSRQEAGIAGRCLIINLPGSVKACRESIPVLVPILPHAVSLLRNDLNEIRSVHESEQKK